MEKTNVLAIFLSMILLSGIITTLANSFIDVEASSEKKDKKKSKKEDTKKHYNEDINNEVNSKDGYVNYNDYNQNYDRYNYPYNYYYNYQDMSSLPYDPVYEGYYDKYHYENEQNLPYSYLEDFSKSDESNNEQYDEPYEYNYESNKYESNNNLVYEENDRKSFKNIKIIECRNLNVNTNELSDIASIDSLNDPRLILEEHPVVSQFENGLPSYDQYREGIYEFYIEPNTKIIFICTNENFNFDSHDTGTTETESTQPEIGIENPDIGNLISSFNTDDNSKIVNSQIESNENLDMLPNNNIEATPSYLNIVQ